MTSLREHGDRHAFLARAASRAARGESHNNAHPLPHGSERDDGFVPIGYRTLTGDLVSDFERNAQRVLLDVQRCRPEGPSLDMLRELIADDKIRTAVVSAAPSAVMVGELLAGLGVDVVPYSRDAAITADLGVSAPRFGIAATGSLVQDSTIEGGRGMSLVPRVHLAILPTSLITATTADVWRLYAGQPMPTNLTLITGPSRTGDIEMILTVGVHGPVRVLIALCG